MTAKPQTAGQGGEAVAPGGGGAGGAWCICCVCCVRGVLAAADEFRCGDADGEDEGGEAHREQDSGDGSGHERGADGDGGDAGVDDHEDRGWDEVAGGHSGDHDRADGHAAVVTGLEHFGDAGSAQGVGHADGRSGDGRQSSPGEGGADADAAGQPGEPVVGDAVDLAGQSGLGEQHAHEDEHGQHAHRPVGDGAEWGGGQHVHRRGDAADRVDADDRGHGQGDGHWDGEEEEDEHHSDAPRSADGSRWAGEEADETDSDESEPDGQGECAGAFAAGA
jgi:hypothetical protein